MRTMLHVVAISLAMLTVAGCLLDDDPAGDDLAPELADGLASGTDEDPVQLVVETFDDRCVDHLPADPIDINSASIDDDRLILNVSYAGGCGEHGFAMCWGPPTFLESYPVGARLALHHDAAGDNCEAQMTRNVVVDLKALRQAHEELMSSQSPNPDYPGYERIVILHIVGLDETLWYER